MEYIVAVDKYRHFAKAADSCGVSQSTLSALVQKLEQELDVTIFDRSSHPIKPTVIGGEIVARAKKVLFEACRHQPLAPSRHHNQQSPKMRQHALRRIHQMRNWGRSIVWMAMGLSLSLTSCAPRDSSLEDQLQAFVSDKDARIGVAVVLPDGKLVGVNADEKFAMMSVMKFPLAMAISATDISFSDSVMVGVEMLRSNTYSPMLEKYPPGKPCTVSIGELLEYSLSHSDNNACDILMQQAGGTQAVDRYMTRLGFEDINIRWDEDEMHRDTGRCTDNYSTPEDMARLFAKYDREFSDEKSLRIKAIVEGCATGLDRLARPLAGTGAVIGHKTGTGDVVRQRVTALNDAGYVHLPDGKRYAIAVFVADSGYSPEATSKLIGDISEIVYRYVSDM